MVLIDEEAFFFKVIRPKTWMESPMGSTSVVFPGKIVEICDNPLAVGVVNVPSEFFATYCRQRAAPGKDLI
jgi:hypothetical protein